MLHVYKSYLQDIDYCIIDSGKLTIVLAYFFVVS